MQDSALGLLGVYLPHAAPLETLWVPLPARGLLRQHLLGGVEEGQAHLGQLMPRVS